MTTTVSEKPVNPSQIVQENSETLTDPQMKWLIKNRSHNGLSESGAVIKVARRIYVIPSIFWEWFLSQKA